MGRTLSSAILILLWFHRAAGAQEIGFRHYLADDGLTNLAIQSLYQDRTGFLWIGTENGLYRFDGRDFQHFPAPGGDYVEFVFQSKDGVIWTGGPRWLGRVDGGLIRPFPLPEGLKELGGQSLAETPDGRLLVATGQGIWTTNAAGNKSGWYWRGKAGALLAEPDALWFGCGTSLCRRPWDHGVDQVFPGAGELPMALARDPSQRLWVRTSSALHHFDPGTRAVIPFAPSFDVRSESPRLHADSRGRILIPARYGLGICERGACGFLGQAQGLDRSPVRDALVDHEGSLWLGYFGRGLVRALGFDQWRAFTGLSGLDSNVIWRIVRAGPDRLWIGTEDGLYRGDLTPDGWRFQIQPFTAGWAVRGLTIDLDQNLWIGSTSGELARLSPSGQRIPWTLPVPPGQRVRINKLVTGSSGSLWALTGHGMFERRPGGDFAFVPGPKRDAPAVFTLREGPRGERWVGGEAGLLRYDGQQWTLLTVRDGLRQNWIAGLALDAEGGVWVGYHGAYGVSRITPASGKWRIDHHGKQQGILSELSYFLERDALGRIWNGGGAGVSIWDGVRWSASYQRSDGLIWDDCNSEAFLAEANGSMWVGTSGGLAHYTPLNRAIATADSHTAPRLQITSLTLGGRSYSLNETPEVDPDRATLSLTVASLSFRHPEPEYRYRLLDQSTAARDDWALTRSRVLTFPSPQPGNHLLELEARSPGGGWSGNPVRFRFQVRPVWWQSWWALLLLAAAVLLPFHLWTRYRFAREESMRRALESAVTERTRELADATARAEHASQLKSEFLASMSHEIRTPLNGVLSLTDIVLKTRLSADQRECLESVKLSGRSLLALLNDLLDLSKIEAGKLEITPVRVPVRELAATALSIFQGQARAKDLSLESRIGSEVPTWIETDELRLNQILHNLLSNAVKFTERGGVTLTVSQPNPGEVAFEVTDTGIGIPSASQQVVFEAFRQVDSGATRKQGGTGLGLAICRKLSRLLGGDLWLRSEPGSGSTFGFTIRAAALPPPNAPLDPACETYAAATRALRVLVVEDNPVNQLVARRLLERLGHQVEIAADGLQALDLLARSCFDVVLMDVEMPEMDGFEATRRIRAIEAERGLPRLPIIAMTARVMAGDRERCLAAGMDDYLEKPVNAMRLAEILAARTLETISTATP